MNRAELFATVSRRVLARNAGNIAREASDLGVRYKSSGVALICVSWFPQVGQYNFANGVYTFSAADARRSIIITTLEEAWHGKRGKQKSARQMAQGRSSLGARRR